MSKIIINNRPPEEMDLAEPGSVWIHTEGNHSYPSGLYWMSDNNGWQEYNCLVVHKFEKEPEDLMKMDPSEKMRMLGYDSIYFKAAKESKCMCDCKK